MFDFLTEGGGYCGIVPAGCGGTRGITGGHIRIAEGHLAAIRKEKLNNQFYDRFVQVRLHSRAARLC